MVKVKEDLTGKIFGKLVVIKQVEDYVTPNGQHYDKWLCKCSCKNQTEKEVLGAHLRSGQTKSCGCLKRNKHDLLGEYGILWENNTGKEVYFDLCNADKILEHTWLGSSTGYSVTRINGKNISMHVFLGYKWHDHINKNKKDNRKENLRKCTKQENNRNKSKQSNCTSKYIGVSLEQKRWRACITVNKKKINLGSYNTEEKALIARLRAEKEYFGEFAPQKDLFSKYGID